VQRWVDIVPAKADSAVVAISPFVSRVPPRESTSRSSRRRSGSHLSELLSKWVASRAAYASVSLWQEAVARTD
jgi:hypothetical protein